MIVSLNREVAFSPPWWEGGAHRGLGNQLWLPRMCLTSVWPHGQGQGAGYLCFFTPVPCYLVGQPFWVRTAPSHVHVVMQNENVAAARALSVLVTYLWLMVRRYWRERKNDCYHEKLSAFTQGWLHSRANNARCCLKVSKGECGGRVIVGWGRDGHGTFAPPPA